MVSFSKIVLPILVLSLVACESGNVKNVKQGSLNVCSSKTIEQMVNGFLENVKWSDGESQRGNAMVIVNGDAEYLGGKSNIELQFAFNEDGTSFHQSYAMVDGREIDIMQSNRILKRMCRDDLARLAEKTASIQSQKDQLRKAGKELTPELLEADKDLGERLGSISEMDMELLWAFFEDDPRMASFVKVKKLKDAIFYDHPETTIGKAFSSTFGKTSWNLLETNNGSVVVEMKGLVDERGLMNFAGRYSVDALCDMYNRNYPEQAPFCLDKMAWVHGLDKVSDKMRGLSVYKHWVAYLMQNAAQGDETKRYDVEQSAKIFAAFAPPGSKIVVQFKTDVGLAIVELGYYGIELEDGTKININEVVPKDTFLNYAYGNQKYTPTTYVKGEDELPIKLYTVDTLVDNRDKQKYKVVSFANGQTWFAENLKFKTKESKCYDDNVKNCDVLGRLYNWDDAMKSCPDGYGLPSAKDWKHLVAFASVNTLRYDNRKKYVDYDGEVSLFATDWKKGTNFYEFEILPAGALGGDSMYDEGYEYDGLEEVAYFWTNHDESFNEKNRRASRKQFGVKYGHDENDFAAVPMSNRLSVRCIKK